MSFLLYFVSIYKVQKDMAKKNHTKAEWIKILGREAYSVCWEKGTELPFSGKYNSNKNDGIYLCVCCKTPLFNSSEKYDSGTGWPSFWAPIEEKTVKMERDTSMGMIRTEVSCASCESHLGHVFPDGPQPTGQRFCINSVSLDFADKKSS